MSPNCTIRTRTRAHDNRKAIISAALLSDMLKSNILYFVGVCVFEPLLFFFFWEAIYVRYNFCILSLSSRRPKRVDLSFVGARTRRHCGMHRTELWMEPGPGPRISPVIVGRRHGRARLFVFYGVLEHFRVLFRQHCSQIRGW